MRPRSTTGVRRRRARANPVTAPFEFAHLLDPIFPPDGSEKPGDVSIALAEPRCLAAAEFGAGRHALTTTEVILFRRALRLAREPDVDEPELMAHDEPESGVDPQAAAVLQPEVQAELEPLFQPLFQPELQAEFQPLLQPELQAEPQHAFLPVAESVLQVELQPEPEPEFQPEHQMELQPEVEFQPEVELEPEVELQPEPEPEPVSRFAAAVLDDDRLPLPVKRRRRLRRR